MSITKTTATSPEVINWLASNFGGILFWIAGAVIGIMVWLGRRWMNLEFLNPQIEMKREIEMLGKKVDEQEHELGNMKRDLAIQTIMIEKTLEGQNELKSMVKTLLERGK